MALPAGQREEEMANLRMNRMGMAALVALSFLAAAADLSAQFQAPGELGALAPANIAKPRPKPPFDITGAWLHGGESERFDPPEGFKLMPEAQKHFDAAAKATKEGKLYRNDIGLC